MIVQIHYISSIIGIDFFQNTLTSSSKGHFLTWGSQHSKRAAKKRGEGSLGMAGGGIRRPHGGMNQLSADPCFSKRARAGVDESLESSWSNKSARSCATQPSAASRGSPTSARTHLVLRLTSARNPIRKVHTWHTWGAEAQALNELSFLRGFVIAGTFVPPRASSCYLPCSPGTGGCS